jgi:hypothetical protein
MPRPNGKLKTLLLELTPGRAVEIQNVGALALYAMLHRLEKATGYRYDMSLESHTITCREGVIKVKKPVAKKKAVKKPAKKGMPMNKKMKC